MKTDKFISEEELETVEYSNTLRDIADDRIYSEINHSHTSGFSDGNYSIQSKIKESARMGFVRLAFTDHYDFTGIFCLDDEEDFSPGYIGEEEFNDFDSLIEALKDNIKDLDHPYYSNSESFDIYVVPGMEVNFDPRDGKDVIIKNHLEEVDEESDWEYDTHKLLSVHHDEKGHNYGNLDVFFDSKTVKETVEDYIDYNIRAAELADKIESVRVLAHPDRIERNPLLWKYPEYESPDIEKQVIANNDTIETKADLQDQIAEAYRELPNMYDKLFDSMETLEVYPEFNPKTWYRHQTTAGNPTIGSEVLRNHGIEFTGGPDSHRIGNSSGSIEASSIGEDGEKITHTIEKTDYKVNETELRLQEIEKLAETNENLVTVLDNLDIPSVRIPLATLSNGNDSKRNTLYIDR